MSDSNTKPTSKDDNPIIDSPISLESNKNADCKDAFNDNLTFGLKNFLSDIPHVSDINYEERLPCKEQDITDWETNHNVVMPADMKQFYSATDGFLMTWSFTYGPNEKYRVGCLRFPRLTDVILLRERDALTISTNNSYKRDDKSRFDHWGHYLPRITKKTIIFEINVVKPMAKVCLIYDTNTSKHPKIYLFEIDALRWIFLAETFNDFVRMSVIHLGLPYWELCFSKLKMPPWAEQLFLLIAPDLLYDESPRLKHSIPPASEMPYNVLCPSIFKVSLSKVSIGPRASNFIRRKFFGKKIDQNLNKV